MSLKNPVTPPGIDPGTVRLVAQRLNHYATTVARPIIIKTSNIEFGGGRLLLTNRRTDTDVSFRNRFLNSLKMYVVWTENGLRKWRPCYLFHLEKNRTGGNAS